MGLIQQ